MEKFNHFLHLLIRLMTHWLLERMSLDPILFPLIDFGSIAHTPNHSLFRKVPSMHDAFPSVGRPLPASCIHKIPFSEISSMKDPGT
jgi:hypothetical protein